jgi:hypothetical protein
MNPAKLAIIIFLVTFGLYVPSIGQTSAPNDKLKSTLIDLEKRSWVAWQKRDGAFYQTFLSDDHVEVGGRGTSSKKEVVDFVGSPVCIVTSYSVDNFNVTILDANAVLIVYHAVQDTKCGGKQVPSPAWVSSLYIKRGGKWLNAMYQQTPEPPK